MGLARHLPCSVILGWHWPGLKAVFEEATGKGGKLGLREKEKAMVGRKEEEPERLDVLDLERVIEQGQFQVNQAEEQTFMTVWKNWHSSLER